MSSESSSKKRKRDSEGDANADSSEAQFTDDQTTTTVKKSRQETSNATPLDSTSTSTDLSTSIPDHHKILSSRLTSTTKFLGKGGFGKVFLFMLDDITKVAVKKIEVDILEKFEDVRKEFMKESYQLYRCRHPRLLNFMGVAFDEEDWWEKGTFSFYLVTEYMEGGSLASALRAEIPAEELLRMAMQVAEGMHHLHKLRMVHRDLKPENILLDRHRDCKVADFGLTEVKNQSSKLSTKHYEAGTAQYAAPEQFNPDRRFPLTEKADVWSFGCVLIRMFGGQTPWPHTYSQARVLSMLIALRRPEIPASVPAPIAALIDRCLQIDPSERPSMLDCYRSLEAIDPTDLRKE